MNSAELFNFAGRCLALDENPDFCPEIRDKLSIEANSDDLIWLCSNHLVLPALYLKFKKHGLLDVFPAEYTLQLKEIYEMNRDSNMKILQQMDGISAMLAREDITHVYLKGAGNLLGQVYEDAGERMIGDIDFLVREEDFEKATGILMASGYLSPWQAGHAAFLPPDHHHFPRLTKRNEPATVEIHRIPVKAQFARRFTSEMIFSQAMPVAGKTHALVPSHKHRFIQNFIHSQLSNSGYRRFTPSLRDYYDGYLLSKKVITREVLQTVEETAKVRVFYCLLARTFHLQRTFTEDARVKRYIRRFDWWQQHPGAHHAYLRVNRLYFLIFGAYLLTAIKSVYSKPYRRFTWMRLKNPEWYKQHFRLRKKQLFMT